MGASWACSVACSVPVAVPRSPDCCQPTRKETAHTRTNDTLPSRLQMRPCPSYDPVASKAPSGCATTIAAGGISDCSGTQWHTTGGSMAILTLQSSVVTSLPLSSLFLKWVSTRGCVAAAVRSQILAVESPDLAWHHRHADLGLHTRRHHQHHHLHY